MIDFIATYMPSYLDLPPADVVSTRERLERFVRIGFPEMDINPNTVVGDLIITPQAYTLAAIETGMEHFMSDLNLGNVANGVVYNCDFVEQYIGNFGAIRSIERKGSGVARLTFSDSTTYILDRAVRFQFNGGVFSMYMPNPGPFTIYPAGHPLVEGENCTALRDTGSNSYYADIPLVGNSGVVNVAAGTAGMISTFEFAELAAITALNDFDSGEETTTVPELAKMTRETIYSASLNTRNGAIRYVKDACPFVEGVFAVKNGDKEMLREYHNPYGISSGCLDLYTRSKAYDFTEKQPVRLYLNEAGTFYEGEFPYTGQIYHFESVTHPDLQVDDLPHVIISTNNAPVPTEERSLGPMATYTRFENLKIAVQVGSDETGTYIEPEVDADGRKFATFTLTYQTDPMQQAIGAAIENADYAPINTSVMTRGFIPVIIDRFEVVYVKKPGVVPLLDEAKDSIKAYIAALSYTDAFSEASIAHIMEIAGVKYTKSIRVRARVQWSVADLIGSTQNDNDPTDTDTLIRVTDNTLVDEYIGEHKDVEAQVIITDADGLRVNYPGDYTAAGLFGCSIRNIRYYVMRGAVTFSEVKEM